MSDKPARKRKPTPAVFVTKSEIAQALSVHPGTIDRWIARGDFPPPHSRPGRCTALWLRAHFDAYVTQGRWPEAAFPSPATR